ncbi:Spindle and kinetochore-associated protein 1 homolog [Olea europaea subsp. europaea]|uniref:SKA complex subunit 1 homolog n=1 Tax=Olea europaea subsp. europaea TaxID=158383 RepID=A0A8S0VDP0_OLEEU|nr:Spindle and kinetochore-associated protein 1 homolog [Olea europaea subsp. europaea]
MYLFEQQKLIEASLRWQMKLKSMSASVPSYLPEIATSIIHDTSASVKQEMPIRDLGTESLNFEEPAPREKKGRASPPMWYIANNELDALPSYMKQRLTLDKVNAAINDMATYADANAQIIMAPRKKLSENMLDRALELREISWNNVVKGKHFFLEADIKGPALKLDNTGKATLTVLRHLGRISETRIGHHHSSKALIIYHSLFNKLKVIAVYGSYFYT